MKFRNQEHYKQVKVSSRDSVKPFFNKSNWLIFVIVLIAAIAVAPYVAITKSHVFPSTLEIYLHQVSLFVIAGTVIVLPLLWVMQFRPYLEMKRGHYYIGKFEIVNKRQVLGFCYLELSPGKRNWVKVSQKIFQTFRTGETIELKRATFGSINSIKKISTLRQRIKGDYYNKQRKELFKKAM